jgi:hypothetical protein
MAGIAIAKLVTLSAFTCREGKTLKLASAADRDSEQARRILNLINKHGQRLTLQKSARFLFQPAQLR